MPSEGSSSTERTGVSNLHCIHCLFSCLWCLVAGPVEDDWELHCQQLCKMQIYLQCASYLGIGSSHNLVE